MNDIALCRNTECSLRLTCLRYRYSPPPDERNTYSAFRADGCTHYIELTAEDVRHYPLKPSEPNR